MAPHKNPASRAQLGGLAKVGGNPDPVQAGNLTVEVPAGPPGDHCHRPVVLPAVFSGQGGPQPDVNPGQVAMEGVAQDELTGHGIGQDIARHGGVAGNP